MSKVSGSDSKNPLYCSFCGKSQHEVRKLIAGPTVFICDECVDLCMDIIREENKSSLTKSSDSIPTPIERLLTEDGIRIVKIFLHISADEQIRRFKDRVANTLGDEADTRIDGLLKLDQRLLGVELVVVGDYLQLPAGNAAVRIRPLGQILEGLEADLADARSAAGQGVDIGDLDGVLGNRGQRSDHCGYHSAE
jgi:hypothetical protein